DSDGRAAYVRPRHSSARHDRTGPARMPVEQVTGGQTSWPLAHAAVRASAEVRSGRTSAALGGSVSENVNTLGARGSGLGHGGCGGNGLTGETEQRRMNGEDNSTSICLSM